MQFIENDMLINGKVFKKTSFVRIGHASFDAPSQSILSNADDRLNGSFTPGKHYNISSYLIGKYPVTIELYRLVMERANEMFGLSISENPTSNDKRWHKEKQHLRPVDNVTFYDAVLFCNVLSELLIGDTAYDIILDSIRIKDGHIVYVDVHMKKESKGFRLPLEEEWEFAARGAAPNKPAWQYVFAGTNGLRPLKELTELKADRNISEFAWYCDNANGKRSFTNSVFRRIYKVATRQDFFIGTHEVGLKRPNDLGIYDLSGNVHEWCWDIVKRKDATKYEALPEFIDIKKIYSYEGFARVMRGGGWPNLAHSICVRNRYWMNPAYCATLFDTKNSDVGFRLVVYE